MNEYGAATGRPVVQALIACGYSTAAWRVGRAL